MITEVFIGKNAARELKKVPFFIQTKFEFWVETVSLIGLRDTMNIRGFHDKPLVGKRLGQRSIRLNRSYRAIYIIKLSSVEFVEVLEVNKHEY